MCQQFGISWHSYPSDAEPRPESRDRKGAVFPTAPLRSRLFRFFRPSLHRLALLVQDIMHHGGEVSFVVDVPSAAVARPALALRGIEVGGIQRPAGIRLEIVHHAIRRLVAADDDVNMSRTNVNGVQSPTPISTNVPNALQDKPATRSIKVVGRLAHSLAFVLMSLRVCGQPREPELLVGFVYRIRVDHREAIGHSTSN